jgi:hypothetical protein
LRELPRQAAELVAPRQSADHLPRAGYPRAGGSLVVSGRPTGSIRDRARGGQKTHSTIPWLRPALGPTSAGCPSAASRSPISWNARQSAELGRDASSRALPGRGGVGARRRTRSVALPCKAGHSADWWSRPRWTSSDHCQASGDETTAVLQSDTRAPRSDDRRVGKAGVMPRRSRGTNRRCRSARSWPLPRCCSSGMTRSGRVRPEFVDEQHCGHERLLFVLGRHEISNDAGYRSPRPSGCAARHWRGPGTRGVVCRASLVRLTAGSPCLMHKPGRDR